MRSMVRFCGIAVVLAATLIALGCSSGASGPSLTEVNNAFSGMSLSMNPAPAPNSSTITYTSGVYDGSVLAGGGTIAMHYVVTGNPAGTAPWSATGTLTFTNVYDAFSGYTFNGTMSVTFSYSDSTALPDTITITQKANLSLSGGTITTLGCNITVITTLPIVGLPDIVPSGTVTANGVNYDIKRLGP